MVPPYSAWQSKRGEVVIVLPTPDVVSRGVGPLVYCCPEGQQGAADTDQGFLLLRREFLQDYVPLRVAATDRDATPPVLSAVARSPWRRALGLLYTNRLVLRSCMFAGIAVWLVCMAVDPAPLRALLGGALLAAGVAGWSFPKAYYSLTDTDGIFPIPYRHLRALVLWEWISSTRGDVPRCPQCERSYFEGHTKDCARQHDMNWTHRAVQDALRQ